MIVRILLNAIHLNSFENSFNELGNGDRFLRDIRN